MDNLIDLRAERRRRTAEPEQPSAHRLDAPALSEEDRRTALDAQARGVSIALIIEAIEHARVLHALGIPWNLDAAIRDL